VAGRRLATFSRLWSSQFPPSPIPVQFQADADIRIGADVGVGRVVEGVEIVDRRDVLGLCSRQRAGSGGEDDGGPSVVLVNMSSSYCEKSSAHFCIRNFDIASEVGACDAH
jgi:hypothetical protein